MKPIEFFIDKDLLIQQINKYYKIRTKNIIKYIDIICEKHDFPRDQVALICIRFFEQLRNEMLRGKSFNFNSYFSGMALLYKHVVSKREDYVLLKIRTKTPDRLKSINVKR